MKTYSKYIREHGITQFLHNWERMKDRQNDELKFGDEIECGIFVVDKEKKTVKLAIRGAEVSIERKIESDDPLASVDRLLHPPFPSRSSC